MLVLLIKPINKLHNTATKSGLVASAATVRILGENVAKRNYNTATAIAMKIPNKEEATGAESESLHEDAVVEVELKLEASIEAEIAVTVGHSEPQFRSAQTSMRFTTPEAA